MNFSNEIKSLKVTSRSSVKIVNSTSKRRDYNIISNSPYDTANLSSFNRSQKMKSVAEAEKSVEFKLRNYSPYFMGKKNKKFFGMHNKFVTIVGNKTLFDPLFNYEYQREDKNTQPEKLISTEKENMIEDNKSTLSKTSKIQSKQNRRNSNNSYLEKFQQNKILNSSRSSINIKSLTEKRDENSEDIYTNYINKKLNNQEIRNECFSNKSLHTNKSSKNIHYGLKKVDFDENVKNRRTYLEEFSVQNDRVIRGNIDKKVDLISNLQYNAAINLSKNIDDSKKIKLQNENVDIPLEDFLTKDHYKEKAILKSSIYERVRNQMKEPDVFRKEIADYHSMNNKLIKEYIYPD